MKTLCTILSVFFLLLFFTSQAQTDPNNDNTWNWLAEPSWILYHTDFNPYVQPPNPFIQNGIGAGLF